MEPDWDKLKKEFKDTGNVVIGSIDCTQQESLCGEHQIKGYPTLKTYKNGQFSEYNGGRDFSSFKRYVESNLDPRPACSLESKEMCSKEDRAVLEASEQLSKADRAAKIKSMEAEIADNKKKAAELEKASKRIAAELELVKLGGNKPEKVEQLLNEPDMRAHCESRTCLFAFLPHILDDGAKGRNEKLKLLNDALKESKKGPTSVGFMWSQGGDQFELEETLGLQFGFPAVIAVNFKKERFGVHKGTLEKDSIKQFLTSLMRGGTSLSPIPANFKVVKADPWDGKDGELPKEEEL